MAAIWHRGSATVLAGLALWIGSAIAERTAGDIQLDSESFNSCGASFSAGGDVELGWTVGQHGMHGAGTDGGGAAMDLQSGTWTGTAAGLFEGTVFLFR